jgi:hypothetical protein
MITRLRIVSWLTMICVLVAIVALSAATRSPTVANALPSGPETAAPPATATTSTPEAIPTAELPTRESFLTADRELSPMLQAIKAAWQEHAAERATLEDELATTTNVTAALAVQRRIEAAIRELELRILRIQVEFARSEGRLEVAERLEITIEMMVTPPTLPAPPERPAPADNR